VHLVHEDVRDALELRVRGEATQEDAGGDEDKPGTIGHARFAPDAIPDDVSHSFAALLGDASRDGHRRHASRLRDEDARLRADAVRDGALQHKLRRLRGLTASRVARDDRRGGARVKHRREDGVASGSRGEGRALTPRGVRAGVRRVRLGEETRGLGGDGRGVDDPAPTRRFETRRRRRRIAEASRHGGVVVVVVVVVVVIVVRTVAVG